MPLDWRVARLAFLIELAIDVVLQPVLRGTTATEILARLDVVAERPPLSYGPRATEVVIGKVALRRDATLAVTAMLPTATHRSATLAFREWAVFRDGRAPRPRTNGINVLGDGLPRLAYLIEDARETWSISDGTTGIDDRSEQAMVISLMPPASTAR